MAKEYIIVDSNNHWHATLTNKEDIDDEIERIKEDCADEMPETIYVYEAKEIKRIENE